jgi:hypothetical protein
MSKETNWQPVISDYKTAIVEDILDGSTYSIRLAKRDRVQHSGGSNDESDGPRIYSKFEMPGYDEVDEEDDDGTRIVAYSDLIEPKLIRLGKTPSTAANDDEGSPRASSLSV